jgi:hypothetical protein
MFGQKKTLFNSVLLLVLTAILFPQPTRLAAELSGSTLLKLLSEKDQGVKSKSFATSFVMSKNANLSDPNQGAVMMDCQATWAPDGSSAVKLVYYYEKEIPVYSPPDSGQYSSIEYDTDRNLIVWRNIERYTLSLPDRNEALEKIKSFFVNPQGKLTDKGRSNTILYRYPVGSPETTFHLKQFELMTGIGFSKYLSTPKVVKSLSSGLIELTAEGSFAQGKGNWKLTLDPNSNYIVRDAVFTADKTNRDLIIVVTSGTVINDGLMVANHGMLKYPRLLELNVEVGRISSVTGPNQLFEEVISRLDTPLPPGAAIYDFRGEKPVVTTVE